VILEERPEMGLTTAHWNQRLDKAVAEERARWHAVADEVDRLRDAIKIALGQIEAGDGHKAHTTLDRAINPDPF